MTSRTEYDRISADFEPYELSIDGRDLAYRDPNNPEMRENLVDSSDENYEANPHAYNMMNPLYDYSYGEMRKAGEALGISNVNDKEEVEQMLAYMSKPTAMEEAKDEQIEEAVESSTPLTDELAQKGAPKSDELQAATDNLQKTVDSIRDGSYVSYRRRPSGTGVNGANESYSRQMLDTQMKNATSGINIDNFTEQREELNEQIQDDFTDKLYRDNESRFNFVA